MNVNLYKHVLTLQGKHPLTEVIKDIFNVIKLAKIVKKTFTTTLFFGNGGFDRASNGTSTQLKKAGRMEVFMDVFLIDAQIRCKHTSELYCERIGTVNLPSIGMENKFRMPRGV